MNKLQLLAESLLCENTNSKSDSRFVREDRFRGKNYLVFDKYLGGTDMNMTHLYGELEKDGKMTIRIEVGDRASNTNIESTKAGKEYEKEVIAAFKEYIEKNNLKDYKINENILTENSNYIETVKFGKDTYLEIHNDEEKVTLAKHQNGSILVKSNHITNKGLVSGFVRVKSLSTFLELASIYCSDIGFNINIDKELKSFYK